MTDKVILDADLRAKLNGVNRQLELCDESGRTVGHFLPDDVYRQLLYTWANAQVTDEELDRASRETGGRPLAEIWRRLGRS
jgi:hypothetical protein